LFTLFNLSREVWFEPFVTIAIFAAVYTFVYFFLVKKMKVDEMIEIPKTRLIIISAIILALEYALNLASFTVQNTIYLEIALFACAVLTIIIQFNVFNQGQLENQCDQIEQLLQKEKAQYNQSKTNIETLNRVCHDLKHQMTALKNNPENDFTNEAENAVLIYDSTAHTGNEALDIVLTEKNLFCIKNDIQFTYIADGKLLNFIKATDIYSIFGNALSNAIECVMKEADTDKRLISLNIYNKDKLLYIDCENYTPSDKSFENVIPKTDKPDADYHGFGLKSIKYITEKYGGTMSICQWEHFFNLKLVYPMPNE
jgi:cell division protein FtsB